MSANRVASAIPSEFVVAYRAVVVLGRAGLWFVMATVRAWLLRRQSLRWASVEPSTAVE